MNSENATNIFLMHTHKMHMHVGNLNIFCPSEIQLSLVLISMPFAKHNNFIINILEFCVIYKCLHSHHNKFIALD